MGQEGSGGPSYGTVGSGGVGRPSVKVQGWLEGSLKGWEALLESRETSVGPREVGRSGRARGRQKDLPCSGSTTCAEDAQINNFWCNDSDASG